MKHSSLFLAATLAAPLCIPILVSAAPAKRSANVPFVWRLHLRPSQKWLTTTDSTMEMLMTMPPMPHAPKMPAMKNLIVQHHVIEQKVLSSNSQGARIEMTYRDLTQHTKVMQGNQVVYDSAHPSGALKNLPDISKGLVGIRISYLLSPTGRISDVRGTQEYQKRMNAALKKAFGGRAGAMPPTSNPMASNALSPQGMAAGLNTMYLAMPKSAVTRGQSWNYATTLLMMGMALSQKGRSTFISRSGHLVSLTQKGALSTTQATRGVPQMPKVDMQGTSMGQVQVDELTGLTQASRSTQNLRSQTTFPNPMKKGQMMSLPMQLKMQTVSKTKLLN